MLSTKKDEYSSAFSRKNKVKKLPKDNEYEEIIARYVKGN